MTRRIPPPPARTFSPDDPSPVSQLAPLRLVWVPDTRHPVGNITARRDRQPLTHSAIRQLMSAPAGR